MSRKSRSGISGGFTSFSGDKLDRDGRFFEGVAKQQAAFFAANSNFEEIANSLTIDELGAFSSYGDGNFMYSFTPERMDDAAKRVKMDATGGSEGDRIFLAEVNPLYRAIDSTIDRFRLRKGVELARISSTRFVTGRQNATLEDLQAAKGSVITSDRYLSTCAADKGLAINRATKIETRVTYKIKIPGGTKGAGIWFGDQRINKPWAGAQREFIIARDSAFTVGDSYLDSKGGIVCELEYVGHGKHHYWDE